LSGVEAETRAAAEIAVEVPVVETETGGAENRAESTPAVETQVLAGEKATRRRTDGKKEPKKEAAKEKTAREKATEKAAKTKAAKRKAAEKAAKKKAAEKAAKKKAGENAESVETKPAKPGKKPKPTPKPKNAKPKKDGKEGESQDPFSVARRRVKQSVPKIVDVLAKMAEGGSCMHAKTLLEMTGARHMFDTEAAGGEGEPWAKLVLERLNEAECTPAENCEGCAKGASLGIAKVSSKDEAKESGE